MILGIQLKPGEKGGLPVPTVFYCGRDAVQMRAAHAELLAKNKDGSASFFSVTNPILVPLQRVVESTEDHPDHIAAQERRSKIAAVAKAAPVQIDIQLPIKLDPESLGKKSKTELLELADKLKVFIEKKSTKAEIIAAIIESQAQSPAPEA